MIGLDRARIGEQPARLRRADERRRHLALATHRFASDRISEIFAGGIFWILISGGSFNATFSFRSRLQTR
jgi:hypothetical protein